METQKSRFNRVLVALLAVLVCGVIALGWMVLSLKTDIDQMRDTTTRGASRGEGGHPYGDSILEDRDLRRLPLPAPDDLLSPFHDDGWDPFAEMERMQERMNRMFGGSFGRFQLGPSLLDPEGSEMDFNPEIDLREEGDRFIVEVTVPGLQMGNLKVRIEGQALTVSGTREWDREVKDRHGVVIRSEHRTGTFSKSIPLPAPVRPEGIETDYKEGVLTVRIPKARIG